LAVLRDGKGLRIRAGTSQHRFTGIWVVVVKDRAFIRSWKNAEDEWVSKVEWHRVAIISFETN
jgi:hypothetical protein